MKSNRMCNVLTTLAASAVLCCAPALAQSGTATSQNSSGNGSMTGSPTSGGSMGQNGSRAGSGSSTGSMNTNMSGANGNMPGMGAAANSGSKDKVFLKKAAQGSLAEIQAGQLALQKSSNDQVKQFAQKMVDDHTKLNEQAAPVAQQLGMQMPTQPMPKEQGIIAKLQGKSGTEFDKAYAKTMVKDHEEDLKEFQKEASGGQDPQVKSLAQQGEPIIQGHLDMAKQLAQSVGVSGGSKSGSGGANQSTTGSNGPAQ